MATEQTIKAVVQLLYAAPLANKPDKTEIPGTVKVFRLTLVDMDDDLLKAAVAQHIALSKWFPAVADIRQAAASLISLAGEVPDSYTAWRQIKQAISAGHTERVHPLALKAMSTLGGIQEFGRSDLNDEASWRARFIQAYERIQQRQAESDMMLPAVAGYLARRRELDGRSMNELVSGLAGRLAA